MRFELAAILLAALLLIVPHHVLSSSRHEVVKLPMSDLLPLDIPGDIYYDQTGHLWIAVGKRVYRFDGYRLSLVHEGLEEEPAASVTSGHIAFSETPGGDIWFVDSKGNLLKYDTESRRFGNALSENNRAIVAAGIESIHYDRNALLWMALDNGNIATLNVKDQRVELINTSTYFGQTDYITGAVSSTPNQIWLISHNGVLLNCRAGHQTCEQFDLAELAGNQEILFEGVEHLASRDTVIVSTHGHGVFEFDSTNFRLTNLPVPSQTSLDSSLIRHVWSTYAKSDDGLWIATMGGLYGISSDFEKAFFPSSNSVRKGAIALQFEPLDDESLIVNFVGEVSLIRKKRFETYTSDSGLVSSMTTAFSQAGSNSVFVGSVQGLSQFDSHNLIGTDFASAYSEADLVDSRIMALHSDGRYLWFGGFAGGLRQLELSTGISHRHLEHEKSASAITKITELDEETLVLGTAGYGLIVFEKSGEFVSHVPVSSPISAWENFVLSIFRDRRGNLIVGSVNGLTILTLNSQNESTVVTKSTKYLENKEIYDVLESSDGSIWVGTFQNGLYKAGAQGSSIETGFNKVVTSPLLPDDTINAIEEDHLGILWLSTNKGLVRLNPTNNSITVYDKSDGLLDEEFNVGASLKDREGFLYFGGNKGFVRFNPSDFVERRTPPPLRLTEILVHRDPVPYDPAYVSIPELVLSHNDHSLDVEFSTMDIISPGRSRYKYRLDGFDDDWVDIGTRNSATFTSLPAGEYLLRVIGADSKGVWNYDGISLPIRVLPAPWLTWWAFTLYGVAILGFLMLLKRFYDTHLLKEKATQEARDMTITATLAMDDLQDQLETENRLVDNLRKHSASSYEMVDEFLTLELEELYGAEIDEPLARARQRLHCLSALESSVYFHLDLIKVNFRDAVDRAFAEVIKVYPHPTAELVLANDCSETLVSVDVAAPLLLLAHELMLNAVVHAFPDSEGIECVTVNFRLEGDSWIFELSDTGCGLPTAIDPACPTTLGMELVARVVSRLGAMIEVSRERGTQYRVTIPDPVPAPT